MPTGTVKIFYSERGFGFIIRDTGGADVFFHVDQVDESI
jgi:cold shock CspA family protein